jgi:hypothetical protein
MLISKFEEIKMLEDETFGEFYTKISDLRNSMVCLGKQILEVKLIWKILRSLPECSRIKVTITEESKYLEEMKIEEHPKSPPRNQVLKHQQLQKPTQVKKTWVPKKTAEREISGEGTPSASSFMQDLVRFLALQLKNEGQDKDEGTHSPRGSRPT